MSPGKRTALTVLAAPLYAIGWLAAIVWTVMLWVAMGVAVGFTDGRALMRPHQDDEVTADGPS